MEQKKKRIIELTEEETTAYYDFLKKTLEVFRSRTTPEDLEDHFETLGSQAVTLSATFSEFGTMITVRYLMEEKVLRYN